MNNIIRRFSLAICLLILSFSTRAQVWDSVGNCGFSPENVMTVSLVTDSLGTPIVAYQDWINSDRAAVKVFRVGTWMDEGPDWVTPGPASSTTLAMGSGNLPYLAYADGYLDNKASVMRFNGLYWEQLGSPAFSPSDARDLTMAIDKSGTTYVGFYDPANNISVMKYNGSQWVYAGDSAFAAGYNISLAIDTGDTPYMVFADAVSGRANVMKLNGSNWVSVGAAGFSAGVADDIAMAIDSKGTPYVVYGDVPYSQRATVMKFDGAGWVNLGGLGFSPVAAMSTCIAIDDTIPYVAYQDGTGPSAYKAFVRRWDGSSWVAVGSSSVYPGEVGSLHFAIAPGSVPYIAFQDQASNYKVTVMKYDFPTEVNEIRRPSVIILSPNPSHGSFNLHISTPQKENATIIITNLTGEKITELLATTNTDTSIQLDVPSGVYFVSVAVAGERVIEKIVVE